MTRAPRGSCRRCWQVTCSPGTARDAGRQVALIEALIHHQDIRRSPGQPRAIPPQRLLPALRDALIAPDTGGFWRIRGVRLIATDLHFSAGAGPQVQGRQRRC